jgi:hypothetical protein
MHVMQFTTLIPAYKPKYLVELLTALRHQTVKPTKIIFSDDSPNQAFIANLSAEPLKSLVADLHVEVVPGPKSGGYNNFRHLLGLYRGGGVACTELFHLLLDDDIIFPTFYERHLEAHKSAKLQCVISRRWTAMESGQPIRDDLPVPSIVSSSTHRMLALEAAMLFAHTVGVGKNWLGEFSNTTFRAEMAAELDSPQIADISFAGLEDLGGFLKASLHGPVGFIQDHLGFFRQSAEQNSANPMGRPLKLAFLAYISLAIAARNLGVLSKAQSADAVRTTSYFILHHYSHQQDMAEICTLLPLLAAGDSSAESEFLSTWKKFSQGSA